MVVQPLATGNRKAWGSPKVNQAAGIGNAPVFPLLLPLNLTRPVEIGQVHAFPLETVVLRSTEMASSAATVIQLRQGM